MTWKALNSDVFLVIETFGFRICFEFRISEQAEDQLVNNPVGSSLSVLGVMIPIICCAGSLAGDHAGTYRLHGGAGFFIEWTLRRGL